jgi:hypothetical protein
LQNTTHEVTPSEFPTPIELIYQIDFKMDEVTVDKEEMPGQCWHRMFRNPVLVVGYPILTKSHAGLGLEMPLNMMALLTGSDRMTEFDGNLFIKGFSTMLVASKVAKDLLVWHYCYNRRKESISYFDHTVQSIDVVGLAQLGSTRHVVGWCTDCVYSAGKSRLLDSTRSHMLTLDRSGRCWL